MIACSASPTTFYNPQGEPILCYGGPICLSSRAPENSYIFDLDMPQEYRGPPLIVDGSGSIAGKINDAWAPACLHARVANLTAQQHWDAATLTPQIVLIATMKIRAGDELLYSCKRDTRRALFLFASHRLTAYSSALQMRPRTTQRRYSGSQFGAASWWTMHGSH